MKTGEKVLASIIAAFFILIILSAAAFAVPQTLNYQGYLKNSGGSPVNGTVSLTFAIYNSPISEIRLWTEMQDVAVADGAFGVVLGNLTSIDLPFDEQYYLGVTVGEEAEMTPRAVLVSVPYAMRASAADTAVSAQTAVSAGEAATLEDRTLSELVTLLDNRYGKIGDSLVADFIGPGIATVGNAVSFTDTSQGVPQSWLWDFHDGSTSTQQNPSHTYTSEGTYAVTLTVNDGATSDMNYTFIHVYLSLPPGTINTVDTGGGKFSSIAIGSDDMPIIAYYDPSTVEIKVARCYFMDCSAIYSITPLGTFAVPDTGNISMAIGADNLPIISYYADFYVNVAHCNESSCASKGIDFVEFGELGYPSIVIGADDLPVISYYDRLTYDLKVGHCSNYLCAPTDSAIKLDSAADDVGHYNSIAIGADGLPVIAYYDSTNMDLKVAHCGDVACTTLNTITTVDSTDIVGQYTSIAIGADGLPVIAYYADIPEFSLNVVHCGNASCTSGNTITTVASGYVGKHTSIAIGTDSLPIISFATYEGGGDGLLKVAHCGNASCSSGNTITTVDTTGSPTMAIGYTSITIGADALPVISYASYDYLTDSSYTLKVAHCGDIACSVW